ncbi:arylamine N-acetyltransferase family protein [Planobispora longispora]|uniref:arylamine N-acetyltransferase family protein n=1 Tax=Planobispora longispora TaxID=28887 RepID=UPI001EF3DE17|nr:arylamine N-acetyltransferase [Planobispora longispora]BFE86946.1 arylamine N-acetyltransferase [Planobispora longispora]
MIDFSAYLRRIGGAGDGPPSAESLRLLHRAHVERVPYECLEIWLDRPTSVDPAESAGRILRGRGGYCYHLNGAFSLLLQGLGYRVTRHFGGVQGNAERPAGVDGNHLVLTVSGLPTAENPGGGWLVDSGLGDALHEPLPLVEGVYRQGPFSYGLRPSEVAPGGWRFDHDPRGSFLGMDFGPESVEMTAFAGMHRHLSTSPDSGFVRVATVQRRDAAGVDILRGLVLTRVGDRENRLTVETPDDYFALLADVFGLTLDDVGPAGRAALWDRLVTAQEAWEASRS